MKKIISLLLSLAMVLALVTVAVSCNSSSSDDDDGTHGEETTAKEIADGEAETESDTVTSTGEETTESISDETTESKSEETSDSAEENKELCYDEMSHKCEYVDHACAVCEAVACIDGDNDCRCDICGLEYSVIGDGICEISGYGNHVGDSVYIPRYVGDYKVVEIGRTALAWENSIKYVYIPDGIVAIRELTFYSCKKLLEVSIPDSVTLIESQSFRDCQNLTCINVSEGNGSYKSENGELYTKDGKVLKAFCAGSAPEYVDIPDGVVRVENYAFDNCNKIKRIIFPDSLVEIGDWAFKNCGALAQINIPANVSSIGEDVFFDCYAMKSILVDENNTTFKDIDGNLYTKDGKTLLQYASGKKDYNFKVPDGVTTIGKKAFAASYYVEYVEVCEGVEVIDDEAFSNCFDLVSISLPSTLKTIGDYAFYNSYDLSSVFIPQNVSHIGSNAFSLCPRLVDISVHSDNQHYASFEGNLYSKDMTTFISYALGKSDTVLHIPEGVTEISENAMCDAQKLVEIVIPEGVKNIGKYAFQQCESLESITIPASVDKIGDSAFSFVEDLKNIYFNGTIDQWNSIDKDDDGWLTWDHSIEAYTVYCTDGEISGGYNR